MSPQPRSRNVPGFEAPEFEAQWELIKRWPGIRAEPKIAWRYLYLASRGGRRQIEIKPAELGADQNTSDDAGRRYLQSLARAGLIEVKHLDGGRKLVTLHDPRDVSKARVSRIRTERMNIVGHIPIRRT